MFEFDKKNFKKNSKMILFLMGSISFLLVVSFLLHGFSSTDQKETDIDESGEVNIQKLVMNEISSNNTGSVSDPFGMVYDWVELYNGTGKDINLTGYTLSDDLSKVRWAFKDVIIKEKQYLIIYLAGKEMDGLYANFSLSKKGGETLVLRNTHGKVVDMVETVSMDKNTSYARNLNGEWKLVNKVTPGYENTEEGYQDYLKSLQGEDDSLLIHEVLVRNGGQFKDNYGDYSGYIELKNTSNSKINLENYSLSNRLEEPLKWKIPAKTLDPGELILIYTSGKDIEEGTFHTSFDLDSKNGVVVLSKQGKIVQKVEYQNLANGYALEYRDGSYVKTGVLSGGFENDANGIEKFASTYEKAPKTLTINEVMNNNYEYLPNNSGNYYDWIELKNNSGSTINLKDYYLTTTLNDDTMYELPDYELKSGSYYIVMASGDSNLSNNSYQHANFKISDIESIYLTSRGKVVDSIFVSNVKNGYSFGRGNYGFIYMDTPTPNEVNNPGLFAVSSSPSYSTKDGVYNDVEGISLEINSGGTVYYTLNGDTPTTNSMRYTEPIYLTETTVVRALSVENGKYNSEIANASYIINENHTLPVISLSVDNDSFDVINAYAYDSIEKEAYAKFFDGEKSFEIPCGLKLFGGTTRELNKKSYALKFKKRYGEGELHYQVFENRDNSVYNTLVLRSGSQDYNVSMIRDPALTAVMEDTSVDVQAMRPVILYINGRYWGIYFLNEKIDEDFVSAHYNIPSDGSSVVSITGEVVAGNSDQFYKFVSFLRNNDMSDMDNYEYVKTLVNMDNLIEFWIAETFVTNNDIINCKLFSSPNYDDGKLHFVFFDLDYGMYFPAVNYYTFMTNENGMGSMEIDPTIPLNLFKNREFRKRFVEKLSEMLKSTWSEEKVLSKINEYHDLIAGEMARNVARWGSSLGEWEEEVEALRAFTKRRKSYLLSQTQYFFDLSDSEMSVFYD